MYQLAKNVRAMRTAMCLAGVATSELAADMQSLALSVLSCGVRYDNDALQCGLLPSFWRIPEQDVYVADCSRWLHWTILSVSGKQLDSVRRSRGMSSCGEPQLGCGPARLKPRAVEQLGLTQAWLDGVTPRWARASDESADRCWIQSDA